jgi:hypothetical protein
MRLSLTSFFLASGLALAAQTNPAVKYLKGTVEGIADNASGTLNLTSVKVLVLEADSTRVEIPYAGVTATDVSAPVRPVEPEPLYKVWTLYKRILPPEPVQSVTLEFRDAEGDRNQVTLELEKPVADRLMARIREAAAKKAAASQRWGDNIWKTARNQAQWQTEPQREAARIASLR